MAAAKRKMKPVIEYKVTEQKPDNGNAKSFKDYIQTDKSKTLITEVMNDVLISQLLNAINTNKEYNILEKFTFSEYGLYFEFLESLQSSNHNFFRKHMNWISNNISFEDLFEMAKVYTNIKIVFDAIIYTNSDNEKIKLGFFH